MTCAHAPRRPRRGAATKQTVLLVSGLAILAVAAVLLLRPALSKPPAPPMAQQFYIDEDGGQESVRPITDLPPLPGRGGQPTLVRAVYVTRNDGATKTLAYLERFTDQGKEQIRRVWETRPGYPGALRAGDVGRWVRDPAPGSPWVEADSPDGRRLLDAALKDGGRVVAP